MGSLANAYRKIIWSADLASEEMLLLALGRMPELKVIKVDRLLLGRAGYGLIARLNDRGLDVFADAKLTEIPSKLLALAEDHLVHRPFMLNCMAGSASGGDLTNDDKDKVEGLKRFADACHAVGTRPCGVTVLTSKREGFVLKEHQRSSKDQVLFYAELLVQCGFTDMVCSPQELPVIRAERRFDVLELNVPGIRPAGSAQGDQARTNTPEQAIKDGATRIIMGRPITDGDPAQNLRGTAESIQPLC